MIGPSVDAVGVRVFSLMISCAPRCCPRAHHSGRPWPLPTPGRSQEARFLDSLQTCFGVSPQNPRESLRSFCCWVGSQLQGRGRVGPSAAERKRARQATASGRALHLIFTTMGIRCTHACIETSVFCSAALMATAVMTAMARHWTGSSCAWPLRPRPARVIAPWPRSSAATAQCAARRARRHPRVP
ncbi:MAG: hypothetical protein ACI81R_003578 [Bradymonadia bacterium]|jgi:hypothetical protein